MSFTLTVQSVIDSAVTRFGDPRKTRFGDAQLLEFYNDSTEELTTRWKVLDQDATFNWVANEDRYSYPDDCVQVKEIQYSSTPSDLNSYREVIEFQTEEDYRAAIYGYKPTGGEQWRYWGRAGFFLAYPKPDTSITQGGLMTYWKLADRQTSTTTAVDGTGATYSRALIELPNSLRGLLRDRMVIGMQVEMGRVAEAQVRRSEWEAQADRILPRMEDRTDDQRTAFRTRDTAASWRVV